MSEIAEKAFRTPKPEFSSAAEAANTEGRVRRVSILSMPLLALIATSFFLPSFTFFIPISVSDFFFFKYGPPNGFTFMLIFPFLVAAVLFLFIAAALLWRSAPPKWSIWVALIGLLLGAAFLVVLAAITADSIAGTKVDGFSPNELIFQALWLFWAALAIGLGAFLVIKARYHDGWHRWAYYLMAYAVLLSPHCLFFVESLSRCGDLYGGCIYIGSVTGLVLISFWAIVPIPLGSLMRRLFASRQPAG